MLQPLLMFDKQESTKLLVYDMFKNTTNNDWYALCWNSTECCWVEKLLKELVPYNELSRNVLACQKNEKQILLESLT